MSVIVTTPEKFPAHIKKVMRKDVPNWQAGMHKKIHFQVSDGMIMRTPVGNPKKWQDPSAAPPGYVGGRARGNWQSSKGWPVAGETGQKDSSGSVTRAANRAALSGLQAYSRSFITNNTPYINDLNDRPNPYHPGSAWSPQAPLQWMEGVLDKVAVQFERDQI